MLRRTREYSREVTKKNVVDRSWLGQIRHGDHFFDTDPKIEVGPEHSGWRDSMIDSRTVDAPLRSAYAEFNPISSTEARERGIYRFHGVLEFCGVTLAHMLGPSLRISWRGNMVDD